jgi:7-keto-8-aminopelargonate synthetase-like enzyme
VFVKTLTEHGVSITETPSPIVAVPVGPAVAAALAATYCHQHNVLIYPVFPPVVEKHTSILRANVVANHRPEDLQRAAEIIADAVQRARAETSPSDATIL